MKSRVGFETGDIFFKYLGVSIGGGEQNQGESYDAPSITIFIKMSKGERGSKKISAFVNKLISMLNDPRNNSCIGWADTPHTFLARTILPKYYKHNNLSSFIRQLNIYGFQKTKTTDQEHYYHHSCLARDNRKQLRRIQRKNPIDRDKANLGAHSEDSSYNGKLAHKGPPSEEAQKNQTLFKPQLAEDPSIISPRQQKQISDLTCFFLSLLRDHSTIEPSRIDQIETTFSKPTSRLNFLAQFNAMPKDIPTNPWDVLNMRQNNQKTKGENDNTQKETTEQKEVSSQQKWEKGEQANEQMGSDSYQGFLALENAERFNSDESSGFEKLY